MNKFDPVNLDEIVRLRGELDLQQLATHKAIEETLEGVREHVQNLIEQNFNHTKDCADLRDVLVYLDFQKLANQRRREQP